MRALMIVVGVVSLGLGFFLLSLTGMLSTKYAPGYSESGFRRIRAGISTNEVLRLVGKPLDTSDGSDGEYWWYTEHNGKGFSRYKRYKLRMLSVTNGAVAGTLQGIGD